MGLAFADDELRGALALVCQSTLDGGKRLPHLADLPPLIPVCRQQLVVLPRALMAAGVDLTHSLDSSVVGIRSLSRLRAGVFDAAGQRSVASKPSIPFIQVFFENAQ